MLIATQVFFLVLLFLLCYISINHLLRASIRAFPIKRVRKKAIISSRHLEDLLISTQVKLSPYQFMLFSLVAATAGITLGTIYFSSIKGITVLGSILLFLPYLWLRSRLVTLQMKHRIDFLPAIESFYQAYVLSETKNVRTVLRASIEGDRMPAAVQKVFDQLYMGLMVHRETAECLRIFAYSLGSRWADHYAALLRFGLEDGADLSAGLRELIADMRLSMRTNHADRNRLLEIRIANFSPLLFLAVFLFVNFRIDPEQAYEYYVLSDTGKNMLLDALLLIGASFAMGLYLSLRRI